MKITSETLDLVHRTLATSTVATWLALRIRNQCAAIVRAGLNDGIDYRHNGEFLLITLAASSASTFMDVGANRGEWTAAFALAANENCRGYAFEPSPLAAELLRRRVKGLHCTVQVIECGLGDKMGETVFYAEPEGGEKSSFVKMFSDSRAKAINVQLRTLDHEFARLGLTSVDVLKIDAEGYDLKVIKGAEQSLAAGKIGLIQFEYNAPWANTGSTLAEAIEILADCRFEVYLLKRNGLYLIDYSKYGEYYGYSNFVAVRNDQRQMFRPLLRGWI